MKDYCRFLRTDFRSKDELFCTVGVNFAAVGPDRAICRVCSLSELGKLPLCPNVNIYTYLRAGPSGVTEVGVKFDCLAGTEMLAEARCDHCPEK